MKDQTKEILTIIPLSHKEVLRNAYNRYMHFVGLYNDQSVSGPQVQEDIANYNYLLKSNEYNLPVVCQKSCIEFMQKVTGLPEQWCEAWEEYEFIEEHGSMEQLAAWCEQETKRIESEKAAHD